MSDEPMGLRERTRRAVRGELMAVAMELFLGQGFDQTSVEQIATAAGLSRRSFFRYFASKDDVLDQALASTGQDIATALATRPTTEEPWFALRRAFDPLLSSIEGEARARPMTAMMLQSPALTASHASKRTSWSDAIAAALQTRLGSEQDDHRDLRAVALAGAAMSCLTTAQARWVTADNTTPLPALLDTTMGAVHPLRAPR